MNADRPPTVSDHALLRFIERALHVDLDALRARIMTPVVAAAIRAGARAVTVEGVKFIVEDGVIVTVYGEKQLLPLKRFKVRKSSRRRGRDVPHDDSREQADSYRESDDDETPSG